MGEGKDKREECKSAKGPREPGEQHGKSDIHSKNKKSQDRPRGCTKMYGVST